MTYLCFVSFSVKGPSPKLFSNFALLKNVTGMVKNSLENNL